jgi:transposase
VVWKKRQCGRTACITEEMKEYLLSTQTLKEWAPFSLINRTLKIEKRFGVKIHYTTLSNFYRRNKVSCRKPQYQYGRKEILQLEIAKDQKLVAFQMAELI